MANATVKHTLLINSLKIRFFKVQLTSFQHHDHKYTDQQQIIHFVWDHFNSLQEIDFNWLSLVICIKIEWMRQKSDFTISKTKSINLMNSVHNEMMHELSDVFLHLISADSFFGEEKQSTIWRRTGFRVITKPNAKIILNAVWIGGNANTHYATVVGMTLRLFCLCMGVTPLRH